MDIQNKGRKRLHLLPLFIWLQKLAISNQNRVICDANAYYKLSSK